MREDDVPKRRVWEIGSHRYLDRRHDFSGAYAEDAEAKNLV